MDRADSEAAARLARQRWPDGVRCVHCGSPCVTVRNRPERRWPQWRCRDCRREFTVVTGTALHGTRRRPNEVDQGCDSVTFDGQAAAKDRSRPKLAEGVISVINALRCRPDGATAAKIADLAGITAAHTRRLLRRLESEGIASVREAPVRDGHRTRSRVLWALSYSPRCVRLLRDAPRTRVKRYRCPVDGAVPPQFWHLFWSGAEGGELRLPRDELHVAGACIGSADLAAESWALRNVSSAALETLAESRGHDTGDVNRRIRHEIRRRNADAAA